MRRIIFFITMVMLGSTPVLRGEDAATEERLNQLSGKIEDLIASQEAQRKRVAELAREIEHLREQQSKPNGSYAGQEELKRLAKAVEEVDRKRLDDNEKTRAELVKLGKSLAGPLTAKSKPAGGSATAPSGGATAEKPTPQEKGYGDYTVQPGDTLSVIVQAYREKNIKLTVDQILKANPGLKPEKLKVGQKIWIPAPQT